MDNTTMEALLYAALSGKGGGGGGGGVPAYLVNQVNQNTSAIRGIDSDLQQIGVDMDALEDAIAHAFDNLTPAQKAELKGEAGDYNDLENIPTIEARQVIGNKSAADLNLASRTYVDTQLGNVEALLLTI